MSFPDPEFWRLLGDAIKAEKADHAAALMVGHVAIENYKQEVGYIGALMWVENKAQEMIRKMNDPKRHDATREDLDV